jgi:formamidopyrimidine-DNA glycosylase
MPELAEVEYFRKKWDPGLRQKIVEVHLHAGKRVFRGSDPQLLRKTLTGAQLLGSEARGKQMLFRFSHHGWLGVHLGMSGELRCEAPDYETQKHDHLVFRQREQSLVYNDPRMFGRLRFEVCEDHPRWWTELPPALTSDDFTLAVLREILDRRSRAPIKGVLLDQKYFPGVGNWMADEILWQSRIHPRTPPSELTPAEIRRIHHKTQHVCQVSMETIGVDWGDPPAGWLIHVRWKRGGHCPKHPRTELRREEVATRTTAWCPHCQPEK